MLRDNKLSFRQIQIQYLDRFHNCGAKLEYRVSQKRVYAFAGLWNKKLIFKTKLFTYHPVGGVLSIFVRRGCTVFQGIVFACYSF